MCVCLGGLLTTSFDIPISMAFLSKLQQKECCSNILCVIHLNLAVILQVDALLSGDTGDLTAVDLRVPTIPVTKQ